MGPRNEKPNQAEFIERLVHLIETDHSVDAPAEIRTWAKNLYRTRLQTAGQPLLKRIIATLTAEIMPGVTAFGERSAAGSTERQMLFQADDNAVELRIARQGAKSRVRGQVLGEGFGSSSVRLVKDGKSLETVSDEDGAFEFLSVPKGTYSLVIAGPENEIFIEDLILGT
jgi:hypothetical protein